MGQNLSVHSLLSQLLSAVVLGVNVLPSLSVYSYLASLVTPPQARSDDHLIL